MSIVRTKPIVAVFGGNDPDLAEPANLLGAAIAARPLILLTGGLGPEDSGVKGAAISGANNSLWIGVDRSGHVGANAQGKGIVISTDLGHKRNYLEASLCDAAICLKGGNGTVSEATFALSLQRPVAFWGDAWNTELCLNNQGQELGLKSMIDRTLERVKENPTGKPSFDTLVNRRALEEGLSTLPPFTFFASQASPTAVLSWIVKALSSDHGGLRGSFPPIEGYGDAIRDYEKWLSRV
jgi:predicted Rossmann-fold nucleotide-binding protein